MRDRRQKQKEKSKIIFEKLMQKKEHIQDMKKAQEKNIKKLENKIEKMTQKKLIFDKKKELEFDNIRKKREELIKKINHNKKLIEREEELRRKDILFDENIRLGKCDSDIFGNTEINIIQKKTLMLSKEDYELRKDFLKKMNKLKSESVSNKSPTERRKLYIEKLRKEAEQRRKEEEERLEKLQMGKF